MIARWKNGGFVRDNLQGGAIMKARVSRILMTAVIMFILAMPVFAGGGTEATTGAVPFNKTGLPIVSKPYTLKVVSVQENETPTDPNKLDLIQQLEKKTGVHIEWIVFNANAQDVGQRIQLLLASNDLPDIFRNGIDAQPAYEYGTQGLLIPLEKLIDAYAPNILANFKTTPVYRTNCIAPDGHIYGLGKLPPLGADTMTMLYINQTWLDKLSLKVPETTDDFYAVLKAFKDKDPNGNGKADEIPFSSVFYTRNYWSSDIPLIGMFGMPGNPGVQFFLKDKNGRPQYWFATEAFKKFATYMHKLYAEGLLDQEIYTQERSNLVAKGNQTPTILGVTASWFPSLGVGTANASQYSTMKVPKGSADGGYYPWLSHRLADGGIAFQITKACKSPGIAMRWINEFYEPTLNIQLNEGPIGTILKKIDDKNFTRFPFPEGQTEASWKNSLSFGGSSTFTWRDTFNLVGVPDNDRKVADRAKYYQPYFPPADSIWPLFMLSTADSELVQPLTDIQQLADRKWADWVMKGGVETEWDGFLKSLNDIGLPKVLDVYYNAKVKTLGK
jgi:putative aldouronate transport system substrate-binding protein